MFQKKHYFDRTRFEVRSQHFRQHMNESERITLDSFKKMMSSKDVNWAIFPIKLEPNIRSRNNVSIFIFKCFRFLLRKECSSCSTRTDPVTSHCPSSFRASSSTAARPLTIRRVLSSKFTTLMVCGSSKWLSFMFHGQAKVLI